MPRLRKRWLVVTGVVTVLALVGVVAAVEVGVANGVFSGRLTSHCRAFIDSQPEPRLTYPGGTLISYRSNEGYEVFNEVDDPSSVAYIGVPAPQSAVDAWYQS